MYLVYQSTPYGIVFTSAARNQVRNKTFIPNSFLLQQKKTNCLLNFLSATAPSFLHPSQQMFVVRSHLYMPRDC